MHFFRVFMISGKIKILKNTRNLYIKCLNNIQSDKHIHPFGKKRNCHNCSSKMYARMQKNLRRSNIYLYVNVYVSVRQKKNQNSV